MDALSGIGFDWRVALINFINFLIILWIFSKFIFPKILKVLKKRKEEIQKGIENTKKTEELLKKINEIKEKILSKAKEDAFIYLKKTKDSAEKMKKSMFNKTQKEVENIIFLAKKSGEKEKQEIIKSSEKEIAKNAILMAEKILIQK